MIDSTGGNIGTGDVPAVEGRIDGPEIIPNMLPSVDQISLINTPDPSSEVDGIISGCQELADKLSAIVKDDIEKHIGDAETNIKAFHAAILGDIDHDLAAVADTVAKCDGKITKQLSDEFKNAWDSSFAAGVSPPTDAQIEAALSGQPIPDAQITDLANPVGLVPGQPIKALPGGGIIDPNTGLPIQAPPVQPPAGIGVQFPGCPAPFHIDNADGSKVYFWYTPHVNAAGQQVEGCDQHSFVVPGPNAGDGGGGGGGGGGVIPGDGGGNGEPPTNGGTVPPVEQQPPSTECPPCEEKPPGEQKPPETAPIEPLKGVNGQIPCGPYMAASFAEAVDKIRPEGVQDTTNGQFTCQPGVANWLSEWGKYVFTAGIAGSKPDFGPAWQNTNNCFNNWVFENIIKPWWPTGDCDVFKSTIIALEGVIPRFIDQWFGVVPKQITTTLDYSANFTCQYLIPTDRDILSAHIKGFLTDAEWRFGTKLLGQCIPWQEKVREAAYQRISVRDAYRLNKLGIITNEEYTEAWTRNGINLEQDQDKFEQAQLQYPGMNDLIRMMVRDVADPQVVEDLGLDEEFEDKWKDQLKQWGEAQGVSDDIARMNWRAHWQNPSPQQIFEWLHRLRPDDRDPNDPNSQTVVDPEFAKKLLQVADYMPGTIDAYIATSYRPYTRVDVRRMWRVGVLDSIDDVRRAYRDLGSDAEHAQNLAEFTVKTETPARAKLAGVMPVSEALKAYTDGLMSQKEVSSVLQNNGLDDDQVSQNLATADDRRAVQSRKKRRDYVKKRFFMGEFDGSALSSELIKAGIPDDVARATADLYIAERDSRRKEPTVAMLCTWFDKGLISLDNYMQRIRNLGFNEADGLKVVEACQIGIKERQFKELEKEQAKQLKAEQARNREAAKLLRAAAAHRRLTHTITVTDGKRSVKDTDSTTQQVS